jgi:hypothetical protein
MQAAAAELWHSAIVSCMGCFPMPDTPLDNALVARILENLRIEPSEHLREMLAQPGADNWSPEALQAARLLLDQRSRGVAPEPVYRTGPTVSRADPGRPSEGLRTGDPVFATGFSLPRGFSWGLFLGQFLGRAWLYPGRIGEIKDQAAYIYYDNGNRGWVNLADVRPLALDLGTRLYCPRRRQTGTITHTTQGQDKDERFYLRYDDGQGEWLTLRMVAMPNVPPPHLGEGQGDVQDSRAEPTAATARPRDTRFRRP